VSTNRDDTLRKNWDRFAEELEPHRHSLFRYCLKLTRNPFDAEDLVSETMIKTFGSRAFTTNNVETPLAFMVRVASRTWIDEQQRRERTASNSQAEVEAAAPEGPDTLAVGDAAGVLYDQLTPVQRAVFVLKEVLDMSHKEIGKVLSISPESSRVILHRSKMEIEDVRTRAPRASEQLVQRFVTSFLAHDVEQLKSLFLDEVEATVFPKGRELRKKEELEWLATALSYGASDMQVRDVLGDQVILVFRTAEQEGEALEEVWLLEESSGKIARVIDYGVSPYLVGWVADYCKVIPRDARFRSDDC